MKKKILQEEYLKKTSHEDSFCSFSLLFNHFKRLFLVLVLSISSLNPMWASANIKGNLLTLKIENGTILDALKSIEKQSNFTFIYKVQDVDSQNRVTLKLENKSLEEVLNSLFEKHSIDYRVVGHTVSLYKNNAKVSQNTTNSKRISGIIKDEKGEPIIGANVLEKGTTNLTVTDINGQFTLNVKNPLIVVSYIGYNSEEISVNKVSSIKIHLTENCRALNEVVVVGYGTQKKVNLTGAVETIDSDKIENRPIKSVSDALQGTISGLTVTSGTGKPGSFANFQVRGGSSINSAGALVIIDGIPGDLNRINPQDIKSISVLKDASSAAIYGARAAEGVILVTTKEANSDKVKIDYSGNFSFNTPTRLPQSNNALDHALLANTAFKNAGLAPVFSDEAIEAIKSNTTLAIPKGNDWIYTSNFDWIKTMMDHSFQQNQNLTISKSSDKLKYLFSAGWLDQDGMFSEYGPDNYDRINLRSNINLEIIKDRLNLDTKVSYSSTNKLYHPEFSGWSIPYSTFTQAGPNMPIYDPNGNYARYRMQLNPIQSMREGGEGNDKSQILEGNIVLTYKPISGLVLKAVGGAIVENSQMKEWRKAYGKYGPNGLISMNAGQSGPNRINQNSSHREYLTGQLLAEYSKQIARNDFKILAGWSAEENKYEDLEASRINIIGNELPALALGATEGWANNANETEWALLSGFMRVNYAYASKYLFEANFRADASSRFSNNNRWGVFPSASIGWRVTEEDFMKDQKIFSNLKFRASWGQLGNQNGLGLYDHIPQYVVGGYYPFKNELGQWAAVNKLSSQNRTWETVEIKNIAVDMGFFNNRLNITGDYFIKNNKDMLVNIEMPSVIGVNVPTSNYGELEVKGWELSVGWSDRIKDFSYSAQFNLSDQKDKLVNYGTQYKGFVAGINQKIQGYSLGSIFGYDTNGYFTSEEEVKNSAVINSSVVGVGDIKYVDQDNDGKISEPNDLVYLGTTTPRFVFGLNLNASWKNFDLGLLFQGVGKRNFYLDSNVVSPFVTTWGNYSYKMHNDYWTPENPNASLPRHYAGSDHNYKLSKHWLQNAAYIRAKNIQLGYTFDKNLTKKIGIERARLYFSGDNLFEFSKLQKDYDPELTTVSGYMYPMMRNCSFGINITL